MGRREPARSLPSVAWFLGRDRELAELEALSSSGQRLVTLVGPGGVGKTSLSLVHARRYTERHAAPARFCDLSEARTAGAVVAAVARALDVDLAKAEGEGGAVARIATALEGRGPSLVVLDNCEQALVPIADAVREWIERAPASLWVATSREPLHLKAEQVYPVLPLSLPANERDVGQSEAAALFEACVRRRSPTFRLDAERAPLVAEIVRRLDGLPLAIELAAARAARLGLLTVLEKLDRPLEILAGGAHDAAARQQTMRKAVAWSWDLLEPSEHAMLEACSVFRAPFTLDAAVEAAAPSMAGDGSSPSTDDHAPSLEVLNALLDKSMLHSALDASGATRLRLYEVVRAFAAERLAASGRGHEARVGHMKHHARVARRTLATSGAAAVEAQKRIVGDELLDFVAALETASDPAGSEPSAARAEDACALLLLLLPTLEAQEPASRLIGRLDAVIELAAGSASPLAARVLIARGEARAATGRFAPAREDLDRVLDDARSRGQAQLEARALGALGLACWHEGDVARAADLLEASRKVARTAGDVEQELLALRRSANLALDSHRLYDAERDLESAKILARRLGDERAEAIVMGTSSLVHHRAGRNERALEDALEALRLMHKTGDAPRAAVTLSNLGVIEQELGRHDDARRHLGEAATAAHSAGDRRLLGFVLGCQGRVEHERGRPASARARFEEALRLLGEVNATRLLGLFRAALAATEAELGQPESAAQHLEEAERVLAGSEAHVTALLAVYRAVVAAHLPPDAPRPPGVPPRPVVPAGARDLAVRDEDLRIALTLLDEKLAAMAPANAGVAPDRPSAHAQSLLVASDGTWFRTPGGPVVRLAKRRNLRRVLVALSRGRLEAPGRALSVADLVTAGWPGERILASAATMRVYATLARLRKLGLADFLVSRGEGYLLDARVPLVLSDGAEP